MAGLYSSDNSINVTVVDGVAFTGASAADGSMNVYEVDGTSFVGYFHPCGAVNVYVESAAVSDGVLHPSGALRVSESGYSGTVSVTVVSGSLGGGGGGGAWAPYVFADFVNGTYTIDGDPVTVDDILTEPDPLTEFSGTWADAKADALSVNGLQQSGASDAMPGLTSAILSYINAQNGVTAVFDVYYASGSDDATLSLYDATFANGADLAARASGNADCVYSYEGSGYSEYTSESATQPFVMIAGVTIGNAMVAAYVSGGATPSGKPPTDVAPGYSWADVSLGTVFTPSNGVGYIRRMWIGPPIAAKDDLKDNIDALGEPYDAPLPTFPDATHFWPMSQSEISGATVNDNGTATAINGTISGTLYADDSPVGADTALRNDVTGYISLGSSAFPALDNPHSWSAWVRMSNLDDVSPNGSTMQTLYSDFKDASNGVRIMMYRATGVQGRLKVSIYKGSGNVHYLTDAQAWEGNNYEAHVGYTWDGAAFAFYVNGQPVASSSGASESKPAGNYIMARSTTLGQIHGSMANVRIWDSALTDADMEAVYTVDTAETITPYGGVSAGRLQFQDDFKGSVLNKGKWQPNWLGGSDTAITKPVNSVETAAYDPAQVTLSGGEVSFTTIASSVTVDKLYDYRSGMINSANRFQFTNGYTEARVFFPNDSDPDKIDNWPAFWSNGDHGTWPDQGENDFVEGLDGVARWHYHAGVDPAHDVNGSGSYDIDPVVGWHVIGCRVQDGLSEYYLDGVKIGEQTSGVEEFDHFLVLSNAMSPEGTYGGPVVVAGTPFKCDWVRHYAVS